MQKSNFQSVISKLAEEVFRQPSLPYDDSRVFRDIPGFDSILAIQYILAIETAFDITLNEEDVDNMHTMGNLLALIVEKKPT
jgi:acyl carrier protein